MNNIVAQMFVAMTALFLLGACAATWRDLGAWEGVFVVVFASTMVGGIVYQVRTLFGLVVARKHEEDAALWERPKRKGGKR